MESIYLYVSMEAVSEFQCAIFPFRSLEKVTINIRKLKNLTGGREK
jgi:hypothetical protein